MKITSIEPLPYHTYMNLGHGKYFHFEGTPIKQHYDYLSDQDFPHTQTLNPPDSCSIEYETAYIGGTSLRMASDKLILCFIYSYIKVEITIKVITRNTTVKRLLF